MIDGIYSGPAKVLQLEPDGRPQVQVLGGSCDRVVAEWAIPYRYEAEPGDMLLVLGQRGRYWVTGVVQGSGRSLMAFEGNTSLRSSGKLELAASGGVHASSPEVRIETDHLETEANHTMQRTDSMDSEVRGLVEERTGSCQRIIDEDDEQTAARHTTVAKAAVKIDGSLLRLS